MGHSAANSNEHEVAHHFKNAEHEFSTAKQGMWLFMLQEVLFFSPLFVAYLIFKFHYFADFHAASHHLDWILGAVNTIILIVSSFTVVRAVSAAQRGNRDAVRENIIFTIICGIGFMLVKSIEYGTKFHHGIVPWGTQEAFFGIQWNPENFPDHPKAHLFFTLYFCMTGLHGIHVLVGIGLWGWLLKRNNRGDFGPNYYTPLEMVGLYWHFVDLVWIYLFPLLYLVG